MKKDTFLSVGEIVGVHGIRGVVKARFHGESPFPFAPGESVLLGMPDGKRKSYAVENMQPHKRLVLMSFEDVGNIETAESLIGAEFLIERSRLPEPEEDTYYWVDLIGISVFAENDRYLGKLASIFPTGGNDVYVIRDGKKELMLPAIDSVIKSISLEEKTMRVVIPEGLES